MDKTVFDTQMTKALLSLAKEEGMIEEDGNKTDNYLVNFFGRSPPDWVRTSVLEQVILSPSIYSCTKMPLEGLYGELLSEEVLSVVDPVETPAVEFETFPSEIIEGMLVSRGEIIPRSEFQPRLSAAFEALKESEEYEKITGKETPDLLELQITELLESDLGLRMKRSYTSDEYNAAKIRQEKFNNSMPIFQALEEYIQVVSVAKREDANISTSFNASNDKILKTQGASAQQSGTDQVALYRIVATGLGKLHYRPTLRDSLALASQPETISLRNMLPVWLNEIAAGNHDEVAYVQKEIIEAKNALSKLSTVETVGTITTWLAVPIAAVEIMAALPPVLGIGASLIGKGASATSINIQNHYKWAMFGNT